MAQEKGHLVIADISGYTAFLTQSELDHAEEILNSLIHTILDNMQEPFTISKLEGDAIFAYILNNSFWQSQTLLEAIERIYFAFSRAIQQMTLVTTCTCTACKLIPTLDLKFVLHHGTFILSEIGGRQELSGPDVIAIHRLLKSEITEKTGVEAYAFFSDSCLKEMGLDDLSSTMIAHSETYEHIGEVSGLVHDLHVVWKMEQERRHVVVDKENAWIDYSYELPVPPAVAWEYLTNPVYVRQWLRALDYKTVEGKKNGRVGAGSVQHCAHGDDEFTTFVIEDWHPFEYYTTRVLYPVLGGYGITTYFLEPTDAGTRICMITAPPESNSGLKTAVLRFMGALKLKKQFEGFYIAGSEIMQKLVADDIKNGKIVVETAVAL